MRKLTCNIKLSMSLCSLIILIASCKSTSSTLDDVIPFRSGAAVAGLGDSYNSMTQKLNPSTSCVSGETIEQAASSSDTQMDLNESGNKLMSELSGEVNGTPRFDFVNVSAQGGFYRSLGSTDRSISLVFSSTIAKSVERLSKPSLDSSLAGKAPFEIFEECGDSFVSQITKGGRIIVSVNLSFASSENKKKWQVLNQRNPPWAKLKKDIKDKASENSGDGVLSINIHQEGGMVDSAPTAARTCSISAPEDLDTCLDAVNAAMDYATNEFPAQVEGSPSILSYRTEKLNNLKGVKGINFTVSKEVMNHRQNLKTQLDIQSEYKSAYESAIQLGMSVSKDSIAKVNSNLSQIQQAADSCYDYDTLTPLGPQWTRCGSSISSLEIQEVNPDTVQVRTLEVDANTLLGASIINTYDTPISVQVRVTAASKWQVMGANTKQYNYQGMDILCGDRCPLNNAPKASLVVNTNGQVEQVRSPFNEYTINPGEALNFYANDTFYSFEDNSGSMSLNWICHNCEGKSNKVNQSDTKLSRMIVNSSNSDGVKFTNRSGKAQSYEVFAYGFWSNGRPLVGSSVWSDPEGQDTACGNSCKIANTATSGLVLINPFGEARHAGKNERFALKDGMSATFVMNDSAGNYGNNLGFLELVIRCTDCK